MVVSESGTTELMSLDIEKIVWKKFKGLSKEAQEILISDELPLAIKNIQDTFHLSDIAIGNVSLFIRKIFFEELTLEECEAKIGSMLITTGGGDPNQARAIVGFIQKEILTIKPQPKVEEIEEDLNKTTVSLPLLQALSKYEKLAHQLITKESIKIKTQNAPVLPTLLYWLKCYREELGVGQHTTFERGEFLFQSENCKRLSPAERERVNLILKSMEENLPLSIDIEQEEIVFPDFHDVVVANHAEPTPIVVAPSVSIFGDRELVRNASHSDAGGMSFSAGHIFPAEKEEIAQKVETMREEMPPQKVVPVVPTPQSFTPIFEPALPTEVEKVFEGSHPFISEEEE